MTAAPLIVAVRRTAVGRAGGLFRTRTLDQLAAPVIEAVLAQTGLPPRRVDAVLMGNALEGGNAARRCALAGGLSQEVPATTLDRQCTSGLDAILDAVAQVAGGRAQAVLAGGAESCSTAPWRVARPAGPAEMPRFLARAPFSAPPYADPDPVAGADALAQACAIPRADQDAWAARSHANAVAAEDAGSLAAEGVRVFDGEVDEAPKRGLTGHRLGRLKPLDGPEGTVTAGTAAPEADAAAVALVLAPDVVRELGLTGRALRLDAGAQAGCDPAWAGYAAVPALERLARAVDPVAAGRIEFNEAFAGQTLACLRAAGLPEDRVSRNGGALAYGHPYGASGTLLLCRLFHDLAPRQSGLAALSAMGGQGTAAMFTRVDPAIRA